MDRLPQQPQPTPVLIRFPNWPLAQFIIDISLVVFYWFAVDLAEQRPRAAVPYPRPDALADAVLVAGAFVLYWLWDEVALQIRKSDEYDGRPEAHDSVARRYVTKWCLAASLLIFAVVACQRPDTTGPVVLVDAALIGLLIWFRIWKERVTDPDYGVPAHIRQHRDRPRDPRPAYEMFSVIATTSQSRTAPGSRIVLHRLGTDDPVARGSESPAGSLVRLLQDDLHHLTVDQFEAKWCPQPEQP